MDQLAPREGEPHSPPEIDPAAPAGRLEPAAPPRGEPAGNLRRQALSPRPEIGLAANSRSPCPSSNRGRRRPGSPTGSPSPSATRRSSPSSRGRRPRPCGKWAFSCGASGDVFPSAGGDPAATSPPRRRRRSRRRSGTPPGGSRAPSGEPGGPRRGRRDRPPRARGSRRRRLSDGVIASPRARRSRQNRTSRSGDPEGAGPTRPSSSGPAAPGGMPHRRAAHAGIRLTPEQSRTAGPRRDRPRCA